MTRHRIYARRAEIPEGIDERSAVLRDRVRMEALVILDLHKRCRDLDRRIRSQLARLKFTSMFHDMDDDTKQEMMQIMILDKRNTRIAEAKMHAFLSNRISN